MDTDIHERLAVVETRMNGVDIKVDSIAGDVRWIRDQMVEKNAQKSLIKKGLGAIVTLIAVIGTAVGIAASWKFSA